MPDTGAPWNIPYVAGTDLVSDWPTDSQTLAQAIADGLDEAQQLVAVKHAIFTGTQSNSTAAGANFAVTDLTITHTLGDATNKLIVSAFFGAASNSLLNQAVGIAVADNGTLINIGTPSGTQTAVTAGGQTSRGDTADTRNVAMPSITMFYAPGDTSAHTYTVRAINVDGNTRTVYINRSQGDSGPEDARAVSALTIMEVKA